MAKRKGTPAEGSMGRAMLDELLACNATQLSLGAHLNKLKESWTQDVGAWDVKGMLEALDAVGDQIEKAQFQLEAILTRYCPGDVEDLSGEGMYDTGHLTDDEELADTIYESAVKARRLSKFLRMTVRQDWAELVQVLD